MPYTKTETDSETKAKRDRKARLDRLVVAALCHFGTFGVVLLMSVLGLIDGRLVLFLFLCSASTIGVFYFLIKSGYNQKFADPNLTIAQIISADIPPAVIFFFLDSGQARALIIVIALIPISFGVFLLKTRQFAIAGLALIIVYACVTACLFIFRPEVLSYPEEIVQAVVLLLMVFEISLIGGYVAKLRGKLHQRNQELKEALVKIKDMAIKDDLTGLYNRRHLIELLKKMHQHANKTGEPFSVCIINIDNFKKIVELHGFQQGDALLKNISSAALPLLAEKDCLGRYGGETFLLILPGASIEIAKLKVEQIHIAVEKLKHANLGSDFRLNFSTGIAQYHKAEDFEATINRADLALYEAKSIGGNISVAKEWHPV